MELAVVAVAVAVALAAAAVAAVAALVAAERWTRTRGLERAAGALQHRLGTVEPVHLALAGHPLLPALLRGGSDAEVTASAVPVGDDARLRDLTVRVEGVRLRIRAGALETGTGTFVATVDEAELARLLPLPALVTRLELRASGLRVWTVVGVPIDTEVMVADGALRVLPDPVQVRSLLELPGLSAVRRPIDELGMRIALPDLPFGAVVRSLTFDDGQVVVHGPVPPGRVRLRRSRSSRDTSGRTPPCNR